MSARAELATAIRIVNLAFAELGEQDQQRVEMIDMDPLEVALRSGDDDRAFAAVAEWAHRQLEAIRVVAR